MAGLKRGPPSWLDLFDCSYMDSSCERVGEAIKGAALGTPILMHDSLRRYLVAELDAYIGEHWRPGPRQIHVEAARRLHERAARLAERFEDRYPFDESDAPLWVDPLRRAWLEFIAYGSGHRMYSDLPRELAAKEAASRRNRKAAQAKRANGKGLTVEGVASYFKAHPRAQIKTARLDLAVQFDVSESTVARRIAEARRLNLIS